MCVNDSIREYKENVIHREFVWTGTAVHDRHRCTDALPTSIHTLAGFFYSDAFGYILKH